MALTKKQKANIEAAERESMARLGRPLSKPERTLAASYGATVVGAEDRWAEAEGTTAQAVLARRAAMDKHLELYHRVDRLKGKEGWEDACLDHIAWYIVNQSLVDPVTVAAFRDLAVALEKAGRLDEALVIAKKALEIGVYDSREKEPEKRVQRLSLKIEKRGAANARKKAEKEAGHE